jgi:4,5-DOPA dioxygenase extradiol
MTHSDSLGADRRQFLRSCASGAAAVALAACAEPDGKRDNDSASAAGSLTKPEGQPSLRDPSARMPVVFVGHGSPMNAIEDNEWSRAFTALGKALPRPKAVLAISAHWCARGSFVTADAMPKTIHDFGGFPKALYEVQYPATGSSSLCARVRQLLVDREAEDSLEWGLDHGTWSVTRHLWPDASVPIVQLSIDERMTPVQMLAVGRSLRDLRAEGVLVLASGNVTHNLRDAFSRMESRDFAAPAWAKAFDDAVVAALDQRDDEMLAGLLATAEGKQAHPHPDHWWPLLHAAGAAMEDDARAYPISGFDLGSLSMRAVRFGA